MADHTVPAHPSAGSPLDNSGEPHWLGRCVAQAQAAIDDYAAAHAA